MVRLRGIAAALCILSMPGFPASAGARGAIGTASLTATVGRRNTLLRRATPSVGPPHYRLVDLGDGSTLASGVSELNDAGDFAGTYAPEGADSDVAEAIVISCLRPAVVYTPGLRNSEPTDLNNRDEVTLYAWNHTRTNCYSFLWTGSRLLPISALHKTEYVKAKALNDSGEIVGYTGGDAVDRYGETNYTAFVDHHGVTRALPTLGGPHAQAFAINDRGDIVGQADLRIPAFKTHACLWSHGRATDLGTLGGANSSAYAISDRGQIVGSSDTVRVDPKHEDPMPVAFVWQDGRMTALETLGGPNSGAYAINAAGEIIGDATAPGRVPDSPGNAYAVLWWHGRIYKLDSLVTGLAGVVLSNESGIDDRGDILADGMKPNHGSVRWYMLIPVGNSTQYAERLAKIRLGPAAEAPKR